MGGDYQILGIVGGLNRKALLSPTTMVRDPGEVDAAPDFQSVLDALDDSDCRAIVEALREPMTAREISEATNIPQSTTYRKLDLLSEATVVTEETKLRQDGHHTTTYRVNFDEVRIFLNENWSLDIQIERPSRSPDERLADLWSEVQQET